MSISRWDPWGEMVSLREAMDHLLRESFVRPRENMSPSSLAVPIDVREVNDQYVVRATIPGVKPEDIHLQITGETLQISGQVEEERQEEEGDWLMRERRFGRFQRTVTLPTTVHADQASAEFENGVLTIHLPKSPEARPRSISVSGGKSAQAIDAQTTAEKPDAMTGNQPKQQDQAMNPS